MVLIWKVCLSGKVVVNVVAATFILGFEFLSLVLFAQLLIAQWCITSLSVLEPEVSAGDRFHVKIKF